MLKSFKVWAEAEALAPLIQRQILCRYPFLGAFLSLVRAI